MLRLSFNLMNILVFLSFLNYFSIAYADYYVACYYYDSNTGSDTKNPSLMRPSKLYVGASTNYFWALDSNKAYVKLNGKIEDSFFIEESLTSNDIISDCNRAIKKGTTFWKTKESFKLYSFKAATSNYSGYEYPIRFLRDDVNKSKIKQVVIFGDSLSDNGNLKRWLKAMPYYPFWFGRFSDGFIWNDFFANLTNIPILNFAFGGAKTEGSNDYYIKDFKDYVTHAGRNLVTGSSQDFINYYLKDYLTSDSYHSKSYYISKPQDTLYVIWIGGNDYISKFTHKRPTEEFFDQPDSINGSNIVFKRSVDNIINQINLFLKQK